MLAWPIQSTKIIFDLGNVLINTNSVAVFKTLGIKNVIFYMFLMHYFSPKTMKTELHSKFYEILNKEEIAKKIEPLGSLISYLLHGFVLNFFAISSLLSIS